HRAPRAPRRRRRSTRGGTGTARGDRRGAAGRGAPRRAGRVPPARGRAPAPRRPPSRRPRRDLVERVVEVVAQRGVPELGDQRVTPDQICPGGYRAGGAPRPVDEGRPHATTDEVARHGATGAAPEGARQARRTGRVGGVIEEHAAPDRSGPDPAPLTSERGESRSVRDAADQADSLLRPLRRRARRTARPARSDIRWRKPCRRARRRLLGWYVRFTAMASSRPTGRTA